MLRPLGPYSWRIGMNVDCSGTTSRPTTTTNRMSLPGNFIHAKA